VEEDGVKASRPQRPPARKVRQARKVAAASVSVGETCPTANAAGSDPLALALTLIPADCTHSEQLHQPTPPRFSLAQSFCSYGYFFLAPNVWVPAPADQHEDGGVFYRPLACPTRNSANSQLVMHLVVRQEPAAQALVIHVAAKRPLQPSERDVARAAVARMLRLDQCLEAWNECHPEAAARGFGRTYRSPTAFEDMVKTITNCNVIFKRTITMSAALCREFGAEGVAFPLPAELAVLSEQELKERAGVGYRAGRIIDLAQMFVDGELTEEWFADTSRPTQEVYDRVLSLKGFGPYATSNVLQLLGRYDCAIEAWDTETVRLMKELGLRGTKPEDFYAAARLRYAPYAPFQFLAYWMELWQNYEGRSGLPSTRWQRHTFQSSL